MLLPNVLGPINEAIKQYHTMDIQVKAATEGHAVLKTEVMTLRTEVLDLKGRVAALEESRNTLRAEMERVKAEAVAKMEALKAETLAELRAVKAETVSELKVQQVRYEADLYHKFVDASVAARPAPGDLKPPQIEK